MWLMTPEGFYSVIEWERKKNDPHNGLLCVRTRSRGDLNRLRKWVPELGETVVTPKGDYRCRAWVTREAWAEGLARMGMAIDYGNFKSEVARRDPQRARLYHRIWSVLGEIQKDGPYGWFARRRRRQPSLFDFGGDYDYHPENEPMVAEDVSQEIRSGFFGLTAVRGHFRGKHWVRPYVRRQV